MAAVQSETLDQVWPNLSPLSSYCLHSKESPELDKNNTLWSDGSKDFHCTEICLPSQLYLTTLEKKFSSWSPCVMAINGQQSSEHCNLEELKPQDKTILPSECVHDVGDEISPWDLSHSLLSFTHTNDLAAVRQLHFFMVLKGVDALACLRNHLIWLYSIRGRLQDTIQVFHKVSNPSVSTWQAIVSAYSLHGENAVALELFFEMQEKDIIPDSSAFLCALRACGSLRDTNQGRLIHEQTVHRGLEVDVVVGNALVDMYSKCGSMEEAHKLFQKLPKHNIESWNALIAGYAGHGHGAPAFELFKEMQREGFNPRRFMFSCILKLCGEIGALEHGRLIHDQVIRIGLHSDVVIGNNLLNMYARSGTLEEAHRVFEDLQNRDLVSWGTLLRGYVRHGHGANALKLFERMQEEGTRPNKDAFLCVLNACASIGAISQGKSIHDQIINSKLDLDVDLGSTLVDMYAKCGDLKEACEVFNNLPFRSVVSWNAMIAGYANEDNGLLALELFQRMQHEGFEPNHITFLCTLKACGNIGALGQVMYLHDLILRSLLESDLSVANALVDSYCKCGALEEARHVLDRMTVREVVSWGGMMAGYAQYADCRSVEECLEKMKQQGLKPDALIYTSALAACSHAGNIQEGKRYFRSMKEDHGIKPGIEHFNCMVGLLGHTGHMNEAKELLEAMPMQPDTTGWLTLLRACRTYGNMALGRECFDRVLAVDCNCTAAYLLMSSIYADACMWEDAKKIQSLRKDVGVWKKPGKAWIEINERVHEFIVGDKTHPQSDSVYAKLESLRGPMKEEGYIPQLGLVLEPWSAKDKEDALHGHSERLAIAFGILSTPEGTTIRIRKNLRVCNDCHTASKIISRIERRQIILRDAYRFHQFEYGICSCGDHF